MAVEETRAEIEDYDPASAADPCSQPQRNASGPAANLDALPAIGDPEVRKAANGVAVVQGFHSAQPPAAALLDEARATLDDSITMPVTNRHVGRDLPQDHDGDDACPAASAGQGRCAAPYL